MTDPGNAQCAAGLATDPDWFACFCRSPDGQPSTKAERTGRCGLKYRTACPAMTIPHLPAPNPAGLGCPYRRVCVHPRFSQAQLRPGRQGERRPGAVVS